MTLKQTIGRRLIILKSSFADFDSLNVIPKADQERLRLALQQMNSDTQPELQMKASELLTKL